MVDWWIGSTGAREADDPRSVGCCLNIVNRRDRVGAATGLFGWVTLAYLAGAVLSWQTFGARVGRAFFPAAGVTVAAMLLSRRSLWPAVVVRWAGGRSSLSASGSPLRSSRKQRNSPQRIVIPALRSASSLSRPSEARAGIVSNSGQCVLTIPCLQRTAPRCAAHGTTLTRILPPEEATSRLLFAIPARVRSAGEPPGSGPSGHSDKVGRIDAQAVESARVLAFKVVVENHFGIGRTVEPAIRLDFVFKLTRRPAGITKREDGPVRPASFRDCLENLDCGGQADAFIDRQRAVAPRNNRSCAERSRGSSPPGRPCERPWNSPGFSRLGSLRQYFELLKQPRQGHVGSALIDHQPHRAFGRMSAHIDDRAVKTRVRHRGHGNKKLPVKVTIGFQKANIGVSARHALMVTPPPAACEVRSRNFFHVRP